MKKLFYIFLFLFPVVSLAQQPWYKDSPMDYAWKNVGNAGFTLGMAKFPSIAFSPVDGLPYVAYMDYANSEKATVSKFDGTNWEYVGNAGFTAGPIWLTCLAFNSSGQPYVSYEDSLNSYKASVMKFDGNNWMIVGSPDFSAGEADYTSLAISPSGQPYVAYMDRANSFNATVMKFDGNNWVTVGNAGFSAGRVEFTSLAFSPSGQPYVAYNDNTHLGRITVMEFDGTDWVDVGNAGFSRESAIYISLAFSPTGQPYVAYSDYQFYGQAAVMKFDGNNWVNIGAVDFSDGSAYFISLVFNPIDGQPYVSFEDNNNPYIGATCMKFDGTNWIIVGSEDFSVGDVGYTSLAFSPSGEPYVAYEDYGNSSKATVMKFDSVMVGIQDSKESEFSLYPNPAGDKITIEISEHQAPCQLSMMNLNGEEVLSLTLIKPKTKIDISNLPNGIYFVRVTNDKSVEVGKLVKQ